MLARRLLELAGLGLRGLGAARVLLRGLALALGHRRSVPGARFGLLVSR